MPPTWSALAVAAIACVAYVLLPRVRQLLWAIEYIVENGAGDFAYFCNV